MPNKLIRLAAGFALAAIALGPWATAFADDASPGQPAQSAAPAGPTASPSAPPPASATPAQPAVNPANPSTAVPAAPAPTPAAPATGTAPAPPPGDSTGQIVNLSARPFAYAEGKADKDAIFSSIMGALKTVKGELDKGGIKIDGRPMAVFLESDETGFHYRAGYPLAAAPEGKTSLSDAVKLGETPAGKAMRFEHAGAYSDIDATYDAITAYLDEKGVDAEDAFIEEYENDVKDADDPSLQVTIFVMTK